jgi:tetrahydromethanopterin S-methyltransferase subunit H
MHYARLCECKPISLAPEILAIMGFTIEEVPTYYDTYTEDEYTATMKCVDSRTCDVEIKYKTYRNEITVFSHDYHNRLQYRSVETQVEYVHELQHIFRIMQINKEIVL